MADAVFVADRVHRISYLNRAALRVSGWTSAEAIGRPLSQFVLADRVDVGAGCRPCQIATRAGERRPAEASYARLDDGAGTIVVCRDIGPALTLSAALSHRAEHDPLTGLANRNRLLHRLRTAVADAAAYRQPVAVSFLDIDGMKSVNDTFGHAAGDELLVAVARRLSASVRSADTVARLGGDEFVVVLKRIGHPANGEAVVRSLHEVLTAPYQVAGTSVRVGVSAGLAFCPDHGVTAAQLLERADQAMYGAKQTRTGVALASV
jgi:diguanylate cyclase (GGDEF)-like protein/PAS domain S-box-containing protein